MGSCLGKPAHSDASPEVRAMLIKMAISNILAGPRYRYSDVARKIGAEVGELSTDVIVGGAALSAFSALYEAI